MISIINLAKTLDLYDDSTIFLMLTIDCFLFGFFSAITTMIYIWYLEIDFDTYKEYITVIIITSLHILACYNYSFKTYECYMKRITLNNLRKNKLI